MLETIQIQLNGECYQIHCGQSVHDLLAQIGLQEKRIAVEVNQRIVPRGQFTVTTLNAQDHVEIITAIGGG